MIYLFRRFSFLIKVIWIPFQMLRQYVYPLFFKFTATVWEIEGKSCRSLDHQKFKSKFQPILCCLVLEDGSVSPNGLTLRYDLMETPSIYQARRIHGKISYWCPIITWGVNSKLSGKAFSVVHSETVDRLAHWISVGNLLLGLWANLLWFAI